MNTTWRSFFELPKNKILFFATILSLAFTLFAFLHFLTFIEFRPGYTFHDPVLALFAPVEVSGLTFLVTYGFALVGIGIAIRQPVLFLGLLQAYMLMTLLRMLTLYFIPLEAPADIIPLRDVFLKSTFYSGRPNLKDLFFSGHTATLFLFAFAFERRGLKVLFFVGGSIVGFLVMLQHVHYSIDVLVAPIVAWTVVTLQRKIMQA